MSAEAEESPDGGDDQEDVRASASRRAATPIDPAALLPTGSLPPGTMLEGAYRIEEEIGRGGVGAVYRAEHVTLGRHFAVKVVGVADQMNAESVSRLKQEARTASSIEHENIVDVTHLGTDPETGLVFVVMELLRGEDLRARIARQVSGPSDAWLPNEETRRLASDLLSALAAAHAAGVVHRDLKPENVFLAKKRKRVQLKVVDFGMSKLSITDSAVKLTKTGQIIGTPLYMAPEQSKDGAEADERADVYSLGVILYEMLAGEVPFPVETVYACILAHATQPAPALGPRRPDVPEAVTDLVMLCLEKDPDKRFADAGALFEAWEEAWETEGPLPPLRRDSQNTSSHESMRAVTQPGEPSSPSRPWLVPLGIVLALGLAAGGWALSSGEESAPLAETQPEPEPIAEPEPEPVAEPEPDPDPEPVVEAPATRTVTIVSTPAGAEVREGDAVLGATPYEIELTEGAPPRELTLSLAGRRDTTVEVSDESGDQVESSLPPRRQRTNDGDDLAGW